MSRLKRIADFISDILGTTASRYGDVVSQKTLFVRGDRDERLTLAPYAYIHPITFASISNGRVPVTQGYILVPHSPTKWIVTTLMPVGRVIFSPNAMPFTGKIQAA